MPTTTRTETRKRGFIGKVFLVLFWLFNALMIFSLFAGLSETSSMSASLTTEAEQAGHAIGTALGVGMLLSVWMAGAVILGLFVFLTRGNKVVVETASE